jgi:hypothetical protein
VTDFAYPTAAGAKLIYGERSFASSSALTSLALPSNVGLSGDSIFSNAFSLTSVDLSKSGLTSLPGELFESAFQLTEVKLPSTLTTIEYNAFGQTASLKSIVIPSSVTSVNSRSFYYAVEAFYLEANSVPSGFEDGWNNDCPVYLYSDVTPTTTPEKYWHYVAGVPTIYPQA